MNTLILHPTEISQWQALVNEAQVNTRLILNENMESYLVFLLLRFSKGSQLFESIIGLDFLKAMKLNTSSRIARFRELGDKSLLFSGLFPELARKRNVSLDYFSEMGQQAYYAAGESPENELSDLFIQLGHQFNNLKKILQDIRSSPGLYTTS